jgi:integrase
MLYILACETGLRRRELCSLTPASFDFKNSCVFVRGDDTKNGAEAVQHFTPGTSQLLQAFTKGKMPGVQLFPMGLATGEMIQYDCKAAGVEIENHRGRLNFHSLRHTTGSYLAAQGVHPKQIQEIMRHSTIDLTMSRYTHLLSGAKQAAVNQMPDFTQDDQKKRQA